MFKKIYLVSLFALLAFGCNTNDDGFYNESNIEAANLVEIETQGNYTIDNVLYVRALVPRLVNEIGQSNLLDVRQTTGNAERFVFSFLLERKQNDGSWQYVELQNRFVADHGIADAGSFILAGLQYDAVAEEYYFRGGLRLTESGEHRLSFGYNSTSTDKVELRSESPGNHLRLNIASTVNGLDSAGYFNFIVE
ncbi:MAG: hypothetical protein ITG00_07685 [Flavobacterium sp.]|nr:hypothetical protein [Flavobacterium sp.]